MRYDPVEMLIKARKSFEKRKHDPAKRLKFLQDAGILDLNGNLNQKYFSQTIEPNKKKDD